MLMFMCRSSSPTSTGRGYHWIRCAKHKHCSSTCTLSVTVTSSLFFISCSVPGHRFPFLNGEQWCQQFLKHLCRYTPQYGHLFFGTFICFFAFRGCSYECSCWCDRLLFANFPSFACSYTECCFFAIRWGTIFVQAFSRERVQHRASPIYSYLNFWPLSRTARSTCTFLKTSLSNFYVRWIISAFYQYGQCCCRRLHQSSHSRFLRTGWSHRQQRFYGLWQWWDCLCY